MTNPINELMAYINFKEDGEDTLPSYVADRIRKMLSAIRDEYVELPKDTDGDVIAIGDKVRACLDGKEFTLDTLMFGECGWTLYNYNTGKDCRPSDVVIVDEDDWHRVQEDTAALNAILHDTDMDARDVFGKMQDIVDRCIALAADEQERVANVGN